MGRRARKRKESEVNQMKVGLLCGRQKKGVETQEGFVVGFYLPPRFFFYGSSLQTQLSLAS